MTPETARRVQVAVIVAFAALALGTVPGQRHEVGPLMILTPPLLDLAVAPVAAAAGAFALFQAIAALAGRGRAAPGAALVPYLRPMLLGVGIFAEILWIAARPRSYWSAAYFQEDPETMGCMALFGSGALAAAAIVLGRHGREVLAPIAAVAIAGRVLRLAFGGAAGAVDPPRATTVLAAIALPMALAAVALIHHGLTKPRLERLGFTPWAAGDLTLAPVVLAVGAVAAWESADFDDLFDLTYQVAETIERHPEVGLPAGAFFAGGLTYLARRVRPRGRGPAAQGAPPPTAPA